MDRKLHVDILILILMRKFYVFWYQTDKRTDRHLHPLRVGWRNFFSTVLEKFLQPINVLRDHSARIWLVIHVNNK
jgi:hypothetical protein